jgi:flagellar basal body rod protein FlgF
MDAVNRSPKYRARRVAFALACTAVLLQDGPFLSSVQASTPPKGGAASSAIGRSGVGRASVGFEHSETIVVRDGKPFRVTQHSATVLQETPSGSSRRPVRSSVARAARDLEVNFGVANDRLKWPATIAQAGDLPESLSLPEFGETDAPAVSQERREHVRHIIERIRPNADPDTIDIWVEQFASLPDGNIEFLVTQSSLLKGDSQLPSILGGAFESTLDSSEARTSQSSTDVMIQPAANRSLIESDDVVSRNLANVMTVGYREELELKAASASAVPGLRRLAMFQHGTGPSVVTGSSLHLAIQTPGAVFFQLEDGRLTRNGMFERLDDGRIGITDGDSVVALKESPVIGSLERVRIEADGTVFEGERPVGVISVGTVQQPELLSTDDGVYFKTDAEVAMATEIELLAGSLELSNVDVPRNRYLQFAHRP